MGKTLFQIINNRVYFSLKFYDFTDITDTVMHINLIVCHSFILYLDFCN